MNHFIYILYSSEDEMPRYVGQTISPHGRRVSHIGQARKLNGNDKKNAWVNSVVESEYDLVLKIIDVANADGICEKERYWIKYFSKNGLNILNAAPAPKSQKNTASKSRGEFIELDNTGMPKTCIFKSGTPAPLQRKRAEKQKVAVLVCTKPSFDGFMSGMEPKYHHLYRHQEAEEEGDVIPMYYEYVYPELQT